RQTLAASPAEPGGLLWLSSCRSDLSGAYVSCSLPCNPKHGPDADAQIPGNTPDTEAAGPCGADRRGLVRVGILEAPPTKLCTLLASTGEAGEYPLADHGALELGEHPHHLEHCFAGRCRRVDPLLVQEQVDALGVKLLQEPEEV